MCGFVWETVDEAEIGPRILAGTAAIAETLRRHADVATRRPQPDRWSTLEYSAHVRDVLLHVRDRFVIGLVEDDPEFKPLYRDQRVDLGLYADDSVDVVADELATAAALFVRTLAAIGTEQLDRPCQYAFPTVRRRTLRWMGQQVVHEVEHHRSDVDANVSTDLPGS